MLFGSQSKNIRSTALVLYTVRGQCGLEQSELMPLFVEEVNKIKKAHHMVWQILGTGPELTNVFSQEFNLLS